MGPGPQYCKLYSLVNVAIYFKLNVIFIIWIKIAWVCNKLTKKTLKSPSPWMTFFSQKLNISFMEKYKIVDMSYNI